MPDAVVYQLKVTLQGVRPPVWRRLLVTGDTSLRELHHVIQTAMGWTDSHLHEWEIDGKRYARPDPDWDDGEAGDEDTRLDRVVVEGQRLGYTYDFGDDWRHRIDVERARDREPDETLPSCVAGRRSCPPEDVGGPWGYAEFLAATRDPGHPRHDELLEWSGPYFTDPEGFDLDAVNQALQDVGGYLHSLPAPPAASPDSDDSDDADDSDEESWDEEPWDDDDEEAFLRAWDEVDEAAVTELRSRLPDMAKASAPGGELRAAVAGIRQGVAAGGWPFDWFRAGNGWITDAVLPADDAECWLQAAASVISPPDDPGWSAEEQSAIMAGLEHLDWIDAVTASVRAGVGADMSPTALRRRLSELDPEDEPLAALAFETMVPLWEALGVSDERGLTRLGAWGLPLALVRAWTPPPA